MCVILVDLTKQLSVFQLALTAKERRIIVYICISDSTRKVYILYSRHLGILRGAYFIGLPLDSGRNPVTFGVHKFAQPRVLGMCHVVIGGLEIRSPVLVEDTDAFV